MARPITPTPVLDAKSGRFFCERIKRDLENPVGRVPTPKLDKVIRMIMADADKDKK